MVNLEKQYRKLFNFIVKLKSTNDYWNDYFSDFCFKKYNLEDMICYYQQLKPINRNEIINNYDSYVSPDFAKCFASREDMLNQVFEVADLSGNHDKVFTNKLTGEKWFIETTTGSTGKPFPVLKSQKELLVESIYLAKQRHKICREADLKSGFLMVHQVDSYLKKIDYRSDDLSKFEELYDYMITQNPKWIFTTALLLKRFSGFLLNRNKNPQKDINKLKFIEVTSQTLEKDEKIEIENLFGVKVVRQYGSREFWCIGYEDEMGRLICNNDYLLLDIVDDENDLICKNDEVGNVIVTSLSNYDMPFFKYHLGDMASLNYTINGEKFISLAEGRKCEKLVNTNYYGSVVFRKVLRRLYFHEKIRDINKIRIIQSSNYIIEVYVEKNKMPDIFFEKRFVEISKFIIDGMDRFTIKFHYYFPFIENNVKDQVFISYIVN